jgi:hypothetical protein
VNALHRASGMEGRQWHDGEMVGLVGVLRGHGLERRTKPVDTRSQFRELSSLGLSKLRSVRHHLARRRARVRDRSHRAMSAGPTQQSNAVVVERGHRPAVSGKGV